MQKPDSKPSGGSAQPRESVNYSSDRAKNAERSRPVDGKAVEQKDDVHNAPESGDKPEVMVGDRRK